MRKKNVVAGLGEIGMPILKILSEKHLVVGYDLDVKLMDTKQFEKYEGTQVSFLHICIPFNKKFASNVIALCKKFEPQIIVLHSTVSPNTTSKLQEKLDVPVIYSAVRGVHSRMLRDVKRYAKFFAIEKNAPKAKWACSQFALLFKKCKMQTKQMRDPLTLELAKIVVDTTYYGWLISYAQLSNMVAKKYGIDYDEMWSFADEVHKILGNRPKMFPGFIGGHCVIPNLKLIDEDAFYQIDKINNIYARKVKNAKTIAKRYVKGKQSRTSKY